MSLIYSAWHTKELHTIRDEELENWCSLYLPHHSWMSFCTSATPYKFVLYFRDEETYTYFRLSNS